MKMKMKSSYARNGGEGGNGPGGNSSCLEMMSQLRMFSSKSKVRNVPQFMTYSSISSSYGSVAHCNWLCIGSVTYS